MAEFDIEQHDLSNKLVDRLLAASAGTASLINLAGTVGSGKTSVLRLAKAMVEQRRKIPLFLSSPATDVETSAIVLADFADGLRQAGILNGEERIVRDPRRKWRDKFQALADRVDDAPDDYVLLCDEPSHWFRRHSVDVDDTPEHNARVLFDWITKRTKCRRIVTGYIPDDAPRIQRAFAPRIAGSRALLEDEWFWQEAAPFAKDVAAKATPDVADVTFLDVSMLVAWSWFYGADRAAQQAKKDFAATSLLESLLNDLERTAQDEPRKRELCRALARLAIVRAQVTHAIFDRLTDGVAADDRAIIKHCLCEQWPDHIALHPLIRHEVLTRGRDRHRWQTNGVWKLPVHEHRSVHAMLFDFQSTLADDDSWRGNIELFYHGALSEKLRPESDERALHFVEQLHEVGRSMSYVYHEHARAAKIFETALQLDEENAYSHHYYAFNLDWNGDSPELVERHYRRATQIQPEHPWWWSRWISYLATRGRFKESQDEWRRAVDGLSVDEGATPAWVYLSLHQSVARWMLHWANLDMADNILKSVPSHVATNAGIVRLQEMLKAMRAAEQGRAVFPLSVPANSWWSPTPHTLLPRSIDGVKLEYWLPARIQSVESAEEIYLLIGKPPAGPGEDAEFEEREIVGPVPEHSVVGGKPVDLTEGRYLELGFYGNDSELKIGLHPNEPWRDPDLLPLVPPPNRWFDRAVAQSWADILRDRR